MPDVDPAITRNRDNQRNSLTALGLPAAAILERAGVLDHQLAPGDTAQDVVLRIWQAAGDHTGEEAIPLRCGMLMPFGAFDVIDYMTAATATVGEGLTQLARYFAIITPNLRWQVQGDERFRRVSLHTLHNEPLVARAFTQFTLGVTVMRFRDGAEGPLRFARARLALPQPANTRAYEELFDCPLSFEHPQTELLLPEASWQLPMKRREAALKRLLEQHIQQLLAARPDHDEPLLRARVAVREALPQGPPRLLDVASRLAMSERTLQRRLRQGGTSFQALVDEERRQTALEHIRNPRLSIGDMAYLLGYSESSAFVRAFKRWTGTTPSSYREV